MKTTLDLNDELVAEAKSFAARRRTTLTRVIEEGLQLRLRANHRSRAGKPARLPVFRGKGGLRKGVDPRSNKSLLRAAEDDDS